MPERTATTEARIEARSGVDLSTLIVAALAAAIAALVTSRLWEGGTLVSTAMTPVIVSLAKEYLERPVRKVGQVAKAPLQAVRETNSYRTVSVGGRGAATAEPFEPAEEPFHPSPPDEDGALESPYRVYRRRPVQRKWWVVGITTGVVAFVVAVAALTLPELVGGRSVTGTGRTTLFHGATSSPSEKDKAKTDTEETTSTPAAQDEQSTPSDQQDQSTTPAATPSTRSAPKDQESTPATPSAPTTPAPTTSSAPDAQP